MSIVERVCQKIAERLTIRGRVHVINPGGTPYLHRYYIFRRRWIKDRCKNLLLVSDVANWVSNHLPSCYLHHFHRGDLDKALHNHPWSFSLSIILTSGYTELRWDRSKGRVVTRLVRPGDINIIRADDYHKVDLVDKENGCWTLFFSGPRIQNWSFWDPQHPLSAPIPWEDYVDGHQLGELSN